MRRRNVILAVCHSTAKHTQEQGILSVFFPTGSLWPCSMLITKKSAADLLRSLRRQIQSVCIIGNSNGSDGESIPSRLCALMGICQAGHLHSAETSCTEVRRPHYIRRECFVAPTESRGSQTFFFKHQGLQVCQFRYPGCRCKSPMTSLPIDYVHERKHDAMPSPDAELVTDRSWYEALVGGVTPEVLPSDTFSLVGFFGQNITEDVTIVGAFR